jgi:hypothetical protein
VFATLQVARCAHQTHRIKKNVAETKSRVQIAEQADVSAILKSAIALPFVRSKRRQINSFFERRIFAANPIDKTFSPTGSIQSRRTTSSNRASRFSAVAR